MKYFLDFDRVIFDVGAFWDEVTSKHLCDEYVDPSVFDIIDARMFVYDDAIDFFKSHDRGSVVIVSAISPELGPHSSAYQKRKIEASGVMEYVRTMVLVEGLKGEHVAKLYDRTPSVFVDDRVSQVKSVHESNKDMHIVQMLRECDVDDSETQSKFPVIETFADLDRVLSIL